MAAIGMSFSSSTDPPIHQHCNRRRRFVWGRHSNRQTSEQSLIIDTIQNNQAFQIFKLLVWIPAKLVSRVTSITMNYDSTAWPGVKNALFGAISCTIPVTCFLRACDARQWMIKSQSEVEGEGWILTLCRTFVKNQRSMRTWVIEVTEFNFEVRYDLWGHLEAIIASEAT